MPDLFEKDFTFQELRGYLAQFDVEKLLREKRSAEGHDDLLDRELNGIFDREMEIDERKIDKEGKTAPMSFSSEEPYQRWWGVEILDHEKKSIRLKRAKKGLPFLVNHNSNDFVGKVRDVQIGDDRKGRGVAHFGPSVRADEIFQDIAGGFRDSTSVGYQIHRMRLEEEDKDNPLNNKYRVVDWEPYEVSTVPIPADATVGALRASAPEIIIKKEREITMCNKCNSDPCVCSTRSSDVDVNAIRQKAESDTLQAEQARHSEIMAIGKEYDLRELAYEYVENGKSVIDFKDAIIKKKFKPKPEIGNAEIGLTPRETKEFSFLRMIRALQNPKDAKLQEAAKFEMECSRAVEMQVKSTPQGFFVPLDVQRDLSATGSATGDEFVATNLLAGSFIDVLRNRMVCAQAGCTFLTGLVGDVAIPKATSDATAYWLTTESTSITESTPATAQLTAAPKNVGALVDLTRQFIMQSSISAENFTRNAIARSLGLGIDNKALVGDGTGGAPTGVVNTSGVGTVTITTPGQPSWANLVDFETDVTTANADFGRLGFAVTPAVRGFCKSNLKTSGVAGYLMAQDGTVNGYNAVVSNQVAANGIYFGNWEELVIFMWGALDILVDPYSQSAARLTRIVGIQTVDVGIRHAAAFSVNA